MSFQIDGKTWEPQTTAEHAARLLTSINTLLQENDIKDEEGNLVQLSPNFSNALYLLLLADANRHADNDAVLAAAINSLNPALCDDEQISNLLPIAGIDRNPGSYSRLTLTATVAAGDTCTIPAGTRAPFGDVYFVTKATAIIDNTAGTTPKTQAIETECDTLGSVVVLTGEIKGFEDSIAGLESVTNLASSIPGVNPESTNDLRKKLTQGRTIKYTLDGCKQALEELTGIAYAKIYFNFSTIEPLELTGGVMIRPRHAYIIVQGSDFSELPETYAEFLNAPTQNAPGAAVNFKNYITQSGQTIPIYFDKATEQTVYVRIWLAEDSDSGESVENQLKRDLIESSAEWEIGEHVTSLLTGKPLSNLSYAKVAYTEVSTDGETWTQHILTNCNVIPRLTDESIDVLQVGEDD